MTLRSLHPFRARNVVLCLAGLAPVLSAWAAAPDWLSLGRQAYLVHDYSAANNDFLQACRVDPRQAQAFYGVGACQTMLGRRATARAYAELALTRAPWAPWAQALAARTGVPPALIQGLAALQQGRTQAALELLMRAAAETGGGLAWRSVAQAQLRLGQLEEADNALDRATQADPGAMDLPALENAVEGALEAFLWQADRASYWQRRGVSLFRHGRFADAADAFRSAAALAPEDAAVWMDLAMAQWKAGDWDGMGRALRRLMALDPSHPGARYLEALYLRQQGLPDQALRQMKALAGSPGGTFAGLAQASLAQWDGGPPAASGSVFVRTLAGPSRTESRGAPVRAVAGQDYLRLGVEAFPRGRHPVDLAYGLYLTPVQPEGGAGTAGNPYHCVELDQHYRPGPEADYQADYLGSLEDLDNGGLIYDSNAARLQGDWKLGGSLSFGTQGEALWERYPDFPGYDGLSALLGVSLSWLSPQGHALVLGVGGRADDAADPQWSYWSAGANAYGRLMLARWGSLSASVSWQPQSYPDFAGGARFDPVFAATAEWMVPLAWRVAALLGDQYNTDPSSVALYGSESNLAYVGLQYNR